MFIIYLLSFIPVLIWAFISPLAERFADFATTMTSIGQILGLVGMVLFSLNLILAGRFKFLDKYLKGLDKVYLHHSQIGAISFSLLLFHPLFLVVKYLLISTNSAALFFVPFVDLPITWGIFSLSLMIVLIGFTFYLKLRYHIWKISHKFMIVVFFLAILHTFFISSDISRNSILRLYILSFALIGLIISTCQVLFGKFFSNNFNYRVVNVNQLNQDIVEIEMEPLKDKMTFIPGQFSFFSFLSKSVISESHPFSISSNPNAHNLKITVKNLGDYTSTLNNLKIGDDVLIDGPYGHFSYQKVLSKNQIWVAGGIGLTPFLSMAQSLDKEYHVDFYYSVKEIKEAIYLEEFKKLSQINPNFHFNLWDVGERGYISADLISKTSNGFIDKDILLCGPPMFMEGLKNQFVLLGLEPKRIHYENFNFNI